MAFNVNQFKNQLVYGGARPSLFEVQMSLPSLLTGTSDGVNDAVGLSGTEFSRKLTFMCKATSLPPSTITAIDVPYFGRKVKVAGNRNFEEWTITVINDEDFKIRKGFESWLASINGHESNLKNGGVGSSPASYQVDAVVKQFGKADSVNPIRQYSIINCFPVSVSAIEVSWGSENEIEEFTVNLAYDYWTVDGSTPTIISI